MIVKEILVSNIEVSAVNTFSESQFNENFSSVTSDSYDYIVLLLKHNTLDEQTLKVGKTETYVPADSGSPLTIISQNLANNNSTNLQKYQWHVTKISK